MIKFFFIYIGIINLLSFLGMGWDKYLAKKNKWRTPEASLFGIAFIGGGIGSYIGMQVFRHKTKKPIFKFGMPIMIIINLISIYYILTSGVLN